MDRKPLFARQIIQRIGTEMDEAYTPLIMKRNGIANVNRIRSSNDMILKAIIFSDDVAVLAKAEATLLRVGSGSEVDAPWIIKDWPVNALRRASLAKEALIEAADAHLVILPMRRAHLLPYWLRDWLHQWAGLRRIPDAAVAVIGAGAPAELSRPVSSELAKLILQHNLNLIIEQVPTVGKAVEKPVSPPLEGEFPLLLELRGFNKAVESSSFRSYGINE